MSDSEKTKPKPPPVTKPSEPEGPKDVGSSTNKRRAVEPGLHVDNEDLRVWSMYSPTAHTA